MFQLSIAVALVQQQQQSSQDVRHDGSRAGAGGGYLRALLGGTELRRGPGRTITSRSGERLAVEIWTSNAAGDAGSDPIRVMSRVILQQEETIARLRQEKCFVLFIPSDQDGILKSLVAVAKCWNEQNAAGNQKFRSPPHLSEHC